MVLQDELNKLLASLTEIQKKQAENEITIDRLNKQIEVKEDLINKLNLKKENLIQNIVELRENLENIKKDIILLPEELKMQQMNTKKLLLNYEEVKKKLNEKNNELKLMRKKMRENEENIHRSFQSFYGNPNNKNISFSLL